MNVEQAQLDGQDDFAKPEFFADGGDECIDYKLEDFAADIDFKIDRGGAGPAQPIKNIVVPEGASHDEQMEVLQREMAADQANRERQEKAKRAEEEKKKQARGEPSRTPPASRRGVRPRLSSPTRPSFAGAEPAKRRLVLCADGRRLG